MKIRRLTIDIILIVLYISISLALGSFSFGLVQLRISECLQVVCLKDKHYIIPLTLGCFITNILGSALGMSILPLDIIVGSFATLLSCYCVYKFRKIVSKNHRPYLSLFMPVLINATLIGILYAFVLVPAKLVLTYFAYTFISIALSEFISCFVLGLLIYNPVLKILEHYDPTEMGYN